MIMPYTNKFQDGKIYTKKAQIKCYVKYYV